MLLMCVFARVYMYAVDVCVRARARVCVCVFVCVCVCVCVGKGRPTSTKGTSVSSLQSSAASLQNVASTFPRHVAGLEKQYHQLNWVPTSSSQNLDLRRVLVGTPGTGARIRKKHISNPDSVPF